MQDRRAQHLREAEWAAQVRAGVAQEVLGDGRGSQSAWLQQMLKSMAVAEKPFFSDRTIHGLLD